MMKMLRVLQCTYLLGYQAAGDRIGDICLGAGLVWTEAKHNGAFWSSTGAVHLFDISFCYCFGHGCTLLFLVCYPLNNFLPRLEFV